MMFASITLLAADKEKRVIEIREPIVRVVGKSADAKAEEVTALGAVVDCGLVVISLKNIEGLRNLSVALPDGKRIVPSAIVMFPKMGIAAISIESKLAAAHAVAVKTGESVRIVRHDSATDSLVVANGLTSSDSRGRSGFLIDVANGNPLQTGVVIDSDGQWLGVVTQDESAVRALDAETIQAFLRQWRLATDNSQEK